MVLSQIYSQVEIQGHFRILSSELDDNQVQIWLRVAVGDLRSKSRSNFNFNIKFESGNSQIQIQAPWLRGMAALLANAPSGACLKPF